MPDEIILEELKLLVGTGLQFKCVDGNEIYLDKLSFIYECGDIESFDGCLYDLKDIGTELCRPIVRPLSLLTEDDLIAAGAIKPRPGDEIQWDLLRSVFILAVHEGNCSFNGMIYLASKHFDIFNWLNKIGEYGQALAVETEVLS